MTARRSPVFVHIEKTAGITLHNMLHRDFATYVSPNPAQFGRMDSETFARLCRRLRLRPAGIGGHMVVATEDYGPHLTDEPYVFTLVRQPLDRALSHLNWRRNVMGQSWTFDEFFDTPAFGNVQCRKIAGEPSADGAIGNLPAFDHVGCTEDFDFSVAKLAADIPGFRPIYRSSNVKTYGSQGLTLDDLTSRQRSKLERENRADLALYEHVRHVVLPEQRGRFGTDPRSMSPGYRFPLRVKAKRKLSNRMVTFAGRRITRALADTDLP